MFLSVSGERKTPLIFWRTQTKDGGESRKKAYKKANSSKEEKKEKRGKRDSEDGRVAGKQGSRRATSLLNLFTSSSSSSPNAQGRFLYLSRSYFTNKNLTDTRPPFLVSSRRAKPHKAKQKPK